MTLYTNGKLPEWGTRWRDFTHAFRLGPLAIGWNRLDLDAEIVAFMNRPKSLYVVTKRSTWRVFGSRAIKFGIRGRFKHATSR